MDEVARKGSKVGEGRTEARGERGKRWRRGGGWNGGATDNVTQQTVQRRIRLFRGKAFKFCQGKITSDPQNAESMKW